MLAPRWEMLAVTPVGPLGMDTGKSGRFSKDMETGWEHSARMVIPLTHKFRWWGPSICDLAQPPRGSDAKAWEPWC